MTSLAHARPTTASPVIFKGAVDPLCPTVFHNDWWLQAATNGDYREAEVRSGSRVVARLPYAVGRKLTGHKICAMPELTHFLGPAIDLGSGSLANRNLRRFHLTQELLRQIGTFSDFYQKLHKDVGDTLAFDAAGYCTGVQFTYEIEPQPEHTTWMRMRDKTRNVIRRAREKWEVEAFDDADAFAAIYDVHLRSRGLVNIYTRIAHACAAALSHDQARIWAVKDRQGAVLGAICTLWDRSAAYYFLATRSLDSDNGVMSLLIWHAICDASRRGLTFDFDGLGTPGSRLFFTGFGGDIKPRYFVTRSTRSFRLARFMRRKFTLPTLVRQGSHDFL